MSVLDRMDRIIEFTGPSAVLGCRYILQCVHDLLYIYMVTNKNNTNNSNTNNTLHPCHQLLLECIRYDEDCYRACSNRDWNDAQPIKWIDYKNKLISLSQ